MPWATIAAIASIAAAGTTAGTTLYNLANQPSGTPPAPSTTPTPLTGPQNASQTAAVSQQLPTLQALTGGSLSPEYAAQFGATGAGVSNDPRATGNIQDAINQFFGLTAPGSSGLTSSGGGSSPVGGGSDILSLLSKPITPAPGGGGGTPGGSDFVNSILSSDTFKGLAA